MTDWKTIEHKVTVRNEPRVMVEVDVEPTSGTVCCEQYLKHGKQTILVYESELAKLEERTQTDAQRRDWQVATEAYERNLAQHIGKIKDPRARELAAKSYGPSPSSFYQEMHPGSSGLPPIRSFKILERGIPAPETPANLQASQFDRLAAVLAELIGASRAPQPAHAGGKR